MATLAGFWVYRLRWSWRLLDRAARRAGIEEALGLIHRAREGGLGVRAVYPLTGLRANADLMLWLVGELEPARQLLLALRGPGLGPHLEPCDVMVGFGGPSAYAPDHQPAFLRGVPQPALRPSTRSSRLRTGICSRRPSGDG